MSISASKCPFFTSTIEIVRNLKISKLQLAICQTYHISSFFAKVKFVVQVKIVTSALISSVFVVQIKLVTSAFLPFIIDLSGKSAASKAICPTKKKLLKLQYDAQFLKKKKQYFLSVKTRINHLFNKINETYPILFVFLFHLHRS